MKNKYWILSILALSMLVYTCKVSKTVGTADSPYPERKFNPNPSPAYLSPEESIKSFNLPKGYHMELVASEPMVTEPVAIAWDGNARMYVAEMNTYMQDADATGEQQNKSRILLLEDTDNDGKMDKRSVFIDNLLLPRMMLCVNHELLVNETNTITIHSYKDTNGDGVADEKRVVYENPKYVVNDQNMEHQRSGLDWNLDNNIYITYDAVRFRYKDGMLKADTIPSGSGGQWGLTHDNYGRLYYSNAGGETPVYRFQINPVYGVLDFSDQYSPEFAQVWPIIATPDVQGGLPRLRPDSTINHTTSSNGQSIFRGDNLPKDLLGDYIVCEPVARTIRRAKVINLKGKLIMQNAYYQQEFIASSDMNFRPVNSYTGPDGNLYIVDMHRGIIQQGNWTRPGSFLRGQIDRIGLAKNVGHGRIYRLVHDGYQQRTPKPKMLDEPASKLLTYLDHPNGWWRDNAQKQLVLLGDKSVVPALKQIVAGEQASLAKKPSPLAKIHSLWTLEGMDAIDKDVLFGALKDEDAMVRKAAVWISERYLKSNDMQMVQKLGEIKNDPSFDVRAQLVLSLYYSKSNEAKDIVKQILAANPDNEMINAAQKAVEKNESIRTYGSRLGTLAAVDREMVLKGAATFKSLCSTCHGADAKGISIAGTNMMAAPPLFNSARLSNDKATAIKILLHGLNGPIEGKTYPSVMPSMGENTDEWIAAVLSYARYEFGANRNRGFGGGGGPTAGGGVPNTRNAVPAIASNQPPGGGGRPGGPGGGQRPDPAALAAAAAANAPVVTPEEVRAIRAALAGRTKPWTIDELSAK